MAEGQPDGVAPESLEDVIQRYHIWLTNLMRQYHGRAFLWGETAARTWLEEQPPFE